MPNRLKETGELIGETTPGVVTTLFWSAVAIIAVVGICLGTYWFVAPAKVAIDNTVFHNSQAYNDGMARDLDELRMAFNQADETGKDGIRATVRHRFAGYDRSRLPADLQLFLTQVTQ